MSRGFYPSEHIMGGLSSPMLHVDIRPFIFTLGLEIKDLLARRNQRPIIKSMIGFSNWRHEAAPAENLSLE